jgi:flagellar motor switch protein FliN/FliY
MVDGRDERERLVQDAPPDTELTPAGSSEEHLALDDLRQICLTVWADLGACPMMVRDVLELKRGSVLALDKLAGEMADIYVNNVPLGRGEVVVLGDSLQVRVAEIFGFTDREGGA